VGGCDFVVNRFSVMPGQVLAPLLGDDGGFVIRPGDGAYGINGLPEHDGDELDFLPRVSPQQVAALVTFGFAYARQKFGFQHSLVGIGVFGFRISVPDSCDDC